MSRRSDDDLSALLDELSGTLDRLQTELDDDRGRRGRGERRGDRDGNRRDRGRRDNPEERRAPRRRRERSGPQIPRPGTFLKFTEEYTIPALIAFLEANVRALELLQGLLRLLRGGEVSESHVESVGRRTLGQVDGLLSDVQGALEGQPSNPEARDLLDEARSLRGEIDDRIAGGAIRREGERGGRTSGRDDDRPTGNDRRSDRQGRSAPVAIDVSDDDGRGNDRRGDESRGSDRRPSDQDREERRGEDRRDGERARRDEVDVDSELDSLRRQVRGDADDDTSNDVDAAGSDDSGGDDADDGDGE
ncbi:hypothetical protein ACFPYI_00135 [Halomarina salina]|uniref:Uncharacterized protein n=1 Tax=Halomarina salina TaxID=1872699 RepID=A0ABD5RGS0_9EURY|nr:hypothetical protein [Halomarina salina]